MTTKKKLGQILLDAGLIDEYQLKSALGYQKKWGGRLGSVLVENRFVTEEALVQAIQRQTGLPAVQLDQRNIPAYLLELVPLELAEKHNLIPIGLEGEAGKSSETLVVAMADPTDLNALDELRFTVGKRIKAALAGERDLARAIGMHYRGESPDASGSPLDPESIQFGGQQVEAADLSADLVVVQGRLEATPGEASVVDDPFAELESLAGPPRPIEPVPAPAPLAPVADGDPFAELDALAAAPAPAAPAPDGLDFDLDLQEEPDGMPEIEVIEDLEIIEEIQPGGQAEVAPPAAAVAPATGAPPPPGERDTSLFGDLLGELADGPAEASETVGSLDSMPPPVEPPALEEPVDLSEVPDLEPAEPTPVMAAPVPSEAFPAAVSSDRGPAEPPVNPLLGDDELDLDAVLEPLAQIPSEPAAGPPSEPPPAPSPRPADGETRADAMQALLSRVGLTRSRLEPAAAPAAPPSPAVQPPAAPEEPEPAPAPSGVDVATALANTDPSFEALVRLLIRKGLISAEEFVEELERG